MSHYLITGGLGLIGAELAKELSASGHQVRVIDNLSSGQRNSIEDNCELVIGDVNDETLVSEAMSGVKLKGSDPFYIKCTEKRMHTCHVI